MKFDHIGIPTTDRFDGEIELPHLQMTVSDHQNNPFGIQWQRYWDDAPYPDLVKTVAARRLRGRRPRGCTRRPARHHRAEQPE